MIINRTKKGKQNKLYSKIIFFNCVLKLINWRELITIEIGNKKFKVLTKSYPSIKKVGVPNNNKPIPKID
tara:strand:+ start:484 stop:693 length:210 start_codon:yes stop_codon:yes gene_type:complete